jgi:hypothetical protein
MRNVLGLALLFLGAAASLMASPIPEIDPSSGLSALVLFSGALLVLRAHRKKND